MRSAEGVEMELPIASPAPRMLAYAIDTLLVAVMMYGGVILVMLVLPLADWWGDRAQGFADAAAAGSDRELMAQLGPLFALVQIVFTFHEFLYFSLWEVVSRGRTPGKYVVGLRVVSATGQPVGGAQALIRNVLRIVDVLPGGYVTGLVAMLVSRTGQRLGDRAAGTVVIRTDRVRRVSEVPLPPGLTPLALSRDQLELLGQRELTLIRATLRRVGSMPVQERQRVLANVVDALSQRLRLARDDASDPLRLLQRLLLTAKR